MMDRSRRRSASSPMRRDTPILFQVGMNTTERPQRYSAVATGLDGIVLDGGRAIMLAPAENKWVPVAVRVPPEVAAQAGAGAHKIVIQVKLLDGDTTLDEKTTFMVPR